MIVIRFGLGVSAIWADSGPITKSTCAPAPLLCERRCAHVRNFQKWFEVAGTTAQVGQVNNNKNKNNNNNNNNSNNNSNNNNK